ncbi:MAG: cytochrome c5 family protein [Methylophaga sp.]|nr:cytochrome c5 family protein [Methylophaga sp.]
MSSQNSGKFFVGSIVTFIIIFGLENVLLSTMQDFAKNVVTPASMTAEDVAERIKPVAEVYVGEAPAVVAAPAANSMSGEQVVTQVCALCHSTGMMSSPKLGKASDWAPRIEKGVDTLYSNAIDGFNMMPARGGRADLSDDDVKAAVDHMLLQVK